MNYDVIYLKIHGEKQHTLSHFKNGSLHPEMYSFFNHIIIIIISFQSYHDLFLIFTSRGVTFSHIWLTV